MTVCCSKPAVIYTHTGIFTYKYIYVCTCERVCAYREMGEIYEYYTKLDNCFVNHWYGLKNTYAKYSEPDS